MNPLRVFCPHIRDDNHEVTSAQDPLYNCVAWSIEYKLRYIWPDSLEQYAWPPTIAREATVVAFEQFFRLMGFVACATPALEDGAEKVAIFEANGEVQHVARQLQDGKWTSKIGDLVDISHSTLDVVAGGEYGVPVRFLKRRISSGRPGVPPLHPPPGLVTPGGARLRRRAGP